MAQEAATRTIEHGRDTATLRRTMVERQLRPYDVTDVPLLERFLSVPRELFLPASQSAVAYSDAAATLKAASGARRSLLPPLVLARLLQGAEIREDETILDIGGAGYSSALIAGLAKKVVMLESDPEIAARAKAALETLGAKNVLVEVGALEKGAPASGPYDAIIVHGAVETPLDALFAQLKLEGRLIAIARPEPGAGQQVIRFERNDGRPGGERPLFSAAAPVLEGFQQPPVFTF
ncbi:MAG: protein-L-isoaspartate O-methyltransferase [Methylocystis sp.]|nr:protein-L-isoaspartate O-methyltransferase [Methylocystis sp.]